MAGIEKICEFSGNYPDSPDDDMYQWKRNSIQIMPRYRNLFRGADAILHITGKEYMVGNKFGSKSFIIGTKEEHEEELGLRSELKERYIVEYDYCLEVKDKSLQGEVEGKYYGHTDDLTTTKRKLKRLLRCRNLKIIDHTRC